jgi:hypothetical protein
MTRNRLLTLPAHGVLKLMLGLATVVSPFLLGFGNGGIIAAVVLGSALIGMAVTIGADERASFTSHRLFDVLFVVATAVAACALAMSGDAHAALYFAGLTALQCGLNVTTRYVAPI